MNMKLSIPIFSKNIMYYTMRVAAYIVHDGYSTVMIINIFVLWSAG